jgi:hypothetical protein
MERAGRLLQKLKLTKHGVSDEQLACAAWAIAVGRTIANRTNATALVRSRLVVHVDDATWQRQLWTLRGQILRRLEEALGRQLITEIEFRIAGPQRKPAQTAVAVETDEADGISDPLFRNVYKAARRKANA